MNDGLPETLCPGLDASKYGLFPRRPPLRGQKLNAPRIHSGDSLVEYSQGQDIAASAVPTPNRDTTNIILIRKDESAARCNFGYPTSPVLIKLLLVGGAPPRKLPRQVSRNIYPKSILRGTYLHVQRA